MAWSDYIKNYKEPNLTNPTAGIEALIMAINERCDALGGYGRIELEKLQLVSDTVFIEIENTLNNIASNFLKPELIVNPENIIFDTDYSSSGILELDYSNTWQNTANVCEYLGEEEIKYNSPLSSKFSAKWLAQKIKIINLFTLARYNPNPAFGVPCLPCRILGECEYKSDLIRNSYYNERSHDELMTLVLSGIEEPYNFYTSDYWVSIASNCIKNYVMGGGGANTRRKSAGAYSARTKFYNADSIISQSYDIIIIAKSTVPYVSHPDSPPVYDVNGANWIEDKGFILLRSRAEKGIMQKSDWFGYSSFYPQPVADPKYVGGLGYYYSNIRGFNLDCAAVIDFAVPGGFEFIEETEN